MQLVCLCINMCMTLAFYGIGVEAALSGEVLNQHGMHRTALKCWSIFRSMIPEWALRYCRERQ